MQTRELEKSSWKTYFDKASRQLKGNRTEVEIVGPELGDQFEVEGGELLGLSYDPRSDEFEVLVKGVDHLIFHPRSVWLEQDGESLAALMIEDPDGNKQIIRVQPPITVH